MKNSIEGNALVFTQGGPTAVINASWVGVVEGLLDTKIIKGVWGALHGIDGISKEEFVDLRAQSVATLQAIARTPATQLGSTRHKPTATENARMLEVFRKYNIRYIFGLGGNDTSESLDIINDAARQNEYELRMFHVAKTVDNDLVESDHTPGYGSAARYVANVFRGVDLDNQAFGGIYLGVCMGRHAGFLTAAAAIGRTNPDEGPHLVYVPERSFDLDRFVADVAEVYKRLGRCVVAVSEGIQDEDGTPILQKLAGSSLEADSHGNVQLSGTGALADALVQRVKKHFSTKGLDENLRARADTYGYVQRSFPDQSEVDREEALALGRFAAECALAGHIDGSVAIQRASDNPYKPEYKLVPLKAVAGKTRHLPADHINAAGNNVTDEFIAWGLPLVGELTPVGRLDKSKMVQRENVTAGE